MTTKTKPFLETVRLMRKQQDILEQRGDALSLAVFDKIESIMNGVRGIKFSANEKARQELAYELAKCELAKEDAETQWEKYKGTAMITQVYQRERGHADNA